MYYIIDGTVFKLLLEEGQEQEVSKVLSRMDCKVWLRGDKMLFISSFESVDVGVEFYAHLN